MGWKNWPAWLKGGIILSLSGIIFDLFAFKQFIPDIYFYQEHLTLSFYIFVIIYGFIIGAILGFIIGKISGSEKTFSMKGLWVGISIGALISFIMITWNAIEKYWNPPTYGWPSIFWYLHFPWGGYFSMFIFIILGALIGWLVGKFKK